MIELLNYSKKYHQSPVLEITAWDFPKACYLLKGANGSGKSTLLQSIAGKLSFKGEIRVNGHSLKKSPRLCRQQVSYVSGEPLFPEFLTGQELLEFFLKTKGRPNWQMIRLMEGFAAPAFLSTPIQTYSSGMLKKLALLLAFTGKPDWILLDEPFNGLDAASAAVLVCFITELYSHYQVGVIIASHQQHPELIVQGYRTVLLSNNKLHF